ncbi:DUF2066 domain-containing protein [Pseudomonas sp. LRF_L74]|uniref:DUF2066 domain-containing protein n=1 Tax=Pseudomonas sp. LRF_L74 TaxID=3369422 RepID=UPI003F5ED085
MRIYLSLLALGCSLLSLPSFAAQVADLYQVREPVASQQPDVREAALGKALETLVLRLTGDARAMQSPGLGGVRKDPQQLVSRYAYEGDALVVDFDPATTDDKLHAAGLPLWSANRPAILTWWLSSNPDGNSLVGDAQESAKPLLQAAQHRGLPLRLPLADLQEQLLATPEALDAGKVEPLREASERYGADALLIVHASETDGKWRAQWTLSLGEAKENGKAEGDNQQALADAVLLDVSQRLAPRFVVKPGAASSLQVEIQGADLARYAELENLLDPLGGRLSKVEGDRMLWEVKASAEQLRAQLALAGLQEVPADEVGQVPALPADPAQPADQAATAPGATPPVEKKPDNLLRFRWQ